MNLTVAIGVLTSVVCCVVFFWLYRSRRVVELQPWENVARRYGLTFTHEGEPHEVILRGDFRGVPIEVSLGGGHAGRPLPRVVVLQCAKEHLHGFVALYDCLSALLPRFRQLPLSVWVVVHKNAFSFKSHTKETCMPVVSTGGPSAQIVASEPY